jgi:drug/metabolite transporter (DMT)-like permease
VSFDGIIAKNQKGDPFGFIFYLYAVYAVLSCGVFLIATPTMPPLVAFLFLVPIALCDVLYLGPYYKALKIADSSVISALFSLNRIFVPVFAYMLFNEVLQPVQYAGFVVVILSCSLLLLNFERVGDFFNARALYLMSSAALILSAQGFLYKYAFAYTDWASAYLTVSLVACALSSITLILPHTRTKVRSQLSYALSVLPLIVFEETFAVFGNALDVFSLDKLPITVVKTIQSTLPIFVLLFTFIAAHVWKSRANKPLSPRLAFVRFVIMLILIYGVYLVISVEVS